MNIDNYEKKKIQIQPEVKVEDRKEESSKRQDQEITLMSLKDNKSKEQPYYTGDDAYLLAYIMYWENGTTNRMSDYLLELTGSVVLNRVARKDFPNTIKGVWLQESQYSTAKHIGEKIKIPKRVTRIANKLIQARPVCPSNIVFQSMFEQGDFVFYEEHGEYICGKD